METQSIGERTISDRPLGVCGNVVVKVYSALGKRESCPATHCRRPSR
jgi:hypothetical protein